MSGGLALFVEQEKARNGHDDLAADLKGRGQAGGGEASRGDDERDRADGADVGSDVLADRAVAAGEAAEQAGARKGKTRSFASLRMTLSKACLGLLGSVAQRHGKAVQLVLAGVAELRTGPGELADAGVPLAQLFFGVDVVERKHGAGVRDLAEALGYLAADALRRRVGGDPGGMRRFNVLELAHEGVIGEVVDLGGVEDVIQVFMVAKLVAELVETGPCVDWHKAKGKGSRVEGGGKSGHIAARGTNSGKAAHISQIGTGVCSFGGFIEHGGLRRCILEQWSR